MKSIFSYSNYRLFLADFYRQKKGEKNFSYREFSKKAGLSSPNYLNLIIKGSRDLTTANIHRFAKALELHGEDTEYFETLVNLNQATTKDERKFYEFRRSRFLKGTSAPIEKRPRQHSTMSEWFHMAVLVLSHGHTQDAAIKKLQDELKMKSSYLLPVLNDLLKVGLLEKDAEGKILISSSQVTFSDPRRLNLAQEKFLRSQLELSLKAFKKTYANKDGKFTSHTLTVPEGALESIHHRFVGFVKQLTCEMDSLAGPENSQLAQINIQVFRPQQWE